MNASYGRDLDLNLLRVFVVVADSGSVTRAASHLYLTQPAVSAALRRLTTAIGALDSTRELQWRLSNAAYGKSGFVAALRGWHERLGAKAFQLEQAAAHGFTTGCILFQGLMVGLVVTAVFAFLTAILEQGILW